MLSSRTLIALAGAAFAIGCASSGQMTADGLTRLERERSSRPNDASVARSLGIAYYRAGRFPDARAALEQAARLDPRDGTSALYLGLTAEQQKDLPAARAAYQSYLRFGRTSRVRRQLEARLAALTRQELQVSARAAIASEQQLATTPGSSKTVAVMPLHFAGSDSTLEPLGRGLAELITIDLSRSHELTVVERARLQALLDEIALQQAGQTDSSTNVRAGRIMQAGRIVNGQILQDSNRLRVDAAIVNTQTAAVSGGAANENTLEQLFAIQKAIVLQLLDSLGVRLTTAERDAIEQRPTRSLQAFLAYSRGLEFEDAGRFLDASRNFSEAARLDPAFGTALQKASQAQAAAQGVGLTASVIETGLAGTQEGDVARKAENGQTPPTESSASANSPANVARDVNGSSSVDATTSAGAGGARTGAGNGGGAPARDPLGAATGAEGRTGSANVTIVVRIPPPTP